VSQGLETVKTSVSVAITEGKTYGDVKAAIEAVIQGCHAPHEEALVAIKEGWSQGAEQRSKAQPISPDEFSAINDFYRAAGSETRT